MEFDEPKTHSCQHCQQLVVFEGLRIPRPMQPDSQFRGDNSEGDRGLYVTSFTFADFKSAQGNACPLLSRIEQTMDWRYSPKFSESSIVLSSPPKSLGPRNYNIPLAHIRLFHCYSHHYSNWTFGWIAKIGAQVEQWIIGQTRWQCFTSSAQSGDPASSFIHSRPIKKQPWSTQTIQSVKSWLGGCENSHAMCSTVHTVKPARVVEIVEENSYAFKLKLTEIESLAELKYAALSYRWGTEPFLKSLHSTIKDLSVDIPFHHLPKTIQDAVTVCQTLGVRYLWVDALCIIQDDRLEVEREVGKMASVYGAAYFTIVAARSTSVQEGFLHERQTFGPQHEVYKLYYEKEIDHSGVIKVLNDNPYWPVDREPIEERGWTLQEELLSRRLIWFGTRGTIWKCCNAEHRDGSTKTIGPQTDHHIIMSRLAAKRRYANSLEKSISAEEEGQASLIDLWYEVLTRFARREFTHSTDKILAISGIAQEFNLGINDEYVAGMWRSNLPQALLWQLRGATTRGHKAKHYQGPSWSWVSLTSDGCGFGPWLTRDPARSSHHDAEVLECVCTPVNVGAPFGALQEYATYIKLKGHIIQGKFDQNLVTWGNHLSMFSNLRFRVVSLDRVVERSDKWPADKFILLIINCSREDNLMGILIQPHATRSGVFERVGRFYVSLEGSAENEENVDNAINMFTSQEKRIVTIV